MESSSTTVVKLMVNASYLPCCAQSTALPNPEINDLYLSQLGKGRKRCLWLTFDPAIVLCLYVFHAFCRLEVTCCLEFGFNLKLIIH